MSRTMQPNYALSSQSAFRQAPRARLRRYSTEEAAAKQRQVFETLRDLGVTGYGFIHGEMKKLPLVLHDGEQIKGIVYGHCDEGFAILVATDLRVLFLDKKPFSLQADEVTYGLVGGVSFGQVGPVATVTLHTRLGDYKMRTMNIESAKVFIDFIEQHCLEHTQKQMEYIYDPPFPELKT